MKASVEYLDLDDNDSTSSSDESFNDSDNGTNVMDNKKALYPDTRTKEDRKKKDESSDDEYDYYNPKDKRRWKEKE